MTPFEQRLAAAAPPSDASAALAAAYAAGRRDAARSRRPWQIATAASLAACLTVLSVALLAPTRPSRFSGLDRTRSGEWTDG